MTESPQATARALADALVKRADWLRDERLNGGDFHHLMTREAECRWLAEQAAGEKGPFAALRSLSTPAPRPQEGGAAELRRLIAMLQHWQSDRRAFLEVTALEDGMRQAAAHLHADKQKIAALESLRPVWAQGWTSDSIAAQASAAALATIWQKLGVADQTSCIARLDALAGEVVRLERECVDRWQRGYEAALQAAKRRSCIHQWGIGACPECGRLQKEANQ